MRALSPIPEASSCSKGASNIKVPLLAIIGAYSVFGEVPEWSNGTVPKCISRRFHSSRHVPKRLRFPRPAAVLAAIPSWSTPFSPLVFGANFGANPTAPNSIGHKGAYGFSLALIQPVVRDAPERVSDACICVYACLLRFKILFADAKYGQVLYHCQVYA